MPLSKKKKKELQAAIDKINGKSDFYGQVYADQKKHDEVKKKKK
jgi:hypothetical protein